MNSSAPDVLTLKKSGIPRMNPLPNLLVENARNVTKPQYGPTLPQ